MDTQAPAVTTARDGDAAAGRGGAVVPGEDYRLASPHVTLGEGSFAKVRLAQQKKLMIDMAERQVLYDEIQEQEAERAVDELQKIAVEAKKRTKERLAENYAKIKAQQDRVNPTGEKTVTTLGRKKPPDAA